MLNNFQVMGMPIGSMEAINKEQIINPIKSDINKIANNNQQQRRYIKLKS